LWGFSAVQAVEQYGGDATPVRAGVHHEPANVQGAVREPDPGHRSGQAGLVVQAKEGFPAVAQFLKRLLQSRDTVESDQFRLHGIGCPLQIPQASKGMRVGQVKWPGSGNQRACAGSGSGGAMIRHGATVLLHARPA
jgi:hypothetical protein